MAKGNKPVKNQDPSDTNHQNLSQDFVKQFLDQQKKELEIRASEIQLEFEREKNQKTIAESSIKANLEDRSDHRIHFEKLLTKVMIGVGAVAIIFAGVICYSLYLGKQEFLIKAAEVVGLFLAGFFAGFGVNLNRSKKQSDSNN